MMKRAILAAFLVFVGVLLIFAVPTDMEGPMLLFINVEHGIRLVDAIGLALALPAWGYLNFLAIRFLIKRSRS
ncbi:MAG: hypothetical protein PVF70_05310 [Anaerolineales bacterium]|jgi:hypothetical protein